MQVDIFACCESASDNGGKLDMVGVGSDFIASEIPATSAHGVVVVQVTMDETDPAHSIELRIVDPEGHSLTGTGEWTVVQKQPIVGVARKVNVHVWDMCQFVFERFGAHWAELVVNGTLSHRAPLFLRPACAA